MQTETVANENNQNSVEIKRAKLTCDHSYSCHSPRKLKQTLTKAYNKISTVKHKRRNAQQKARSFKVKIKSMTSLIMALKERNMISQKCQVMLQQSFSGVPPSLMKRMLLTKHTSGHGINYSEEMRSFAMTLQFYSAKAYEFVRKAFDLALPHQAHIRKWYGKVSAEPGLTEQAFDAIEQRVAEANVLGKKVVLSLMLDEMAITKHISWDRQKQWRSVRVFKVFSEYPTLSRKNNNLHYVAIKVLFLKCSFTWQI